MTTLTEERNAIAIERFLEELEMAIEFFNTTSRELNRMADEDFLDDVAKGIQLRKLLRSKGKFPFGDGRRFPATEAPMTTCPILPIGSRICIVREDAEQVTKGGIHLPQNAQKKSEFGRVVAVGPGDTVDGDPTNHRYAVDVAVGQIVAIDKYGGTEIEVNDVKYVVIKQADVLAVINK